MSLLSLRQVFEQNKSGIISIRELDKHSRSRMLISEVAKQYGYTPYYTRNSHKVNYYAHHTYIAKHS
ncbi:hypothetical protein [Moraxella sp. ZY200743]|uniref:hypothetical protein n=1 Tax=Moraxella sp. ZY200743 TaxID=2911970 RepID=UPI003D7EFD07